MSRIRVVHFEPSIVGFAFLRTIVPAATLTAHPLAMAATATMCVDSW